jgi:hypothetical protein
MSHTTVIRIPTSIDTWQAFTCHHNGDMSGDITITARAGTLQYSLNHATGQFGPEDEIKIPFEVMKQLVANWIRNEEIAELEQMSPDRILKGAI